MKIRLQGVLWAIFLIGRVFETLKRGFHFWFQSTKLSAIQETLCWDELSVILSLASPVRVVLSAFPQLWPSNYIFAHLRTESVKECKKSGRKVKEIRGIFGKFQMAASVRILRINASYSTQRLFRMVDWRISGLILKNW